MSNNLAVLIIFRIFDISKENTMRYTVKFYDGQNIRNHISTNDMSEAIEVERLLNEKYKEVWIADSVTEILVG